MMIELAIQIFAITVEVLFPKPRTFSKERIDNIAVWLTSPESGFALRPEQVHLRTIDVAFEYELNAQLFGGNGAFALNAQKAVFAANNARSRADGDLLLQMINRFLRTFAVPENETFFRTIAPGRSAQAIAGRNRKRGNRLYSIP
jgi:hypothetical protein